MSSEVLHYAAFTDRPSGGNPAGVVLAADDLDAGTMLASAAEVGYSETAFVTGRRGERDLDVRYFSPRAEVPFCGHATVATAVALAERVGVGPFRLSTAVGPIAVETAERGGALLATLTSVPTRSRPATADESVPLLDALGWTTADLDPTLPVHVSHSGNDHPVVPVRDRATLSSLAYDYPALDALTAARGWTTVQVVWREDPATFHARDPFPAGGVVEDPATGSAALALGAYLRELGEAPADGRVVVHQGRDLGRPSLLEVETATGDATVRVTGGAVPMELG